VSSFYSQNKLAGLGFKSLGVDVSISKLASIHGAEYISIGNNSRIDDFCVLSAGTSGITIGRNVHIAVYSSLIGHGEICIGDFSNISSRVSIYSSNDDYSGEFLTNPTVQEEYTNVTHGPVIIAQHVIIGAGAVVLPNVNLRTGACVGALSFVRGNCEEFCIYAGVPAKKIGRRSSNFLKMAERRYRENPESQSS
jgi:acetyltransferase-like isoleucine patch superfamily enzyme